MTLIIRKIILYFIFIYSINYQNVLTQNNNLNTKNNFKKYINILTSDSLEGREAGKEGSEKTANWLSNTFKQLNLQTCDTCLYEQTVNVITCKGDTAYSKNILGYIINNHYNNYNNWILICAHYDHLGQGCKYSRSINQTKIHKGADDNASGIAMLIEIAKSIQLLTNKKYNYIFAAFTGHETGLWGSKFYTKHPTINYKNIDFVINLDMLGRLDEKSNALIMYASHDDIFTEIIKNTQTNLNIITKKNYIEGDHSIFETKDIHAVMFSTGIHDDYHTINDIPELINYNGMVEIKNFIINCIIQLENIKIN